MRKSGSKPKVANAARRKLARGQRETAEKLEVIRAQNSTDIALQRDLRARKPR